MSEQIKQKIIGYLENHSYLRLATIASDGKPMAHTVGYVNEGPIVYFSTHTNTRKMANIRNNQDVAYTVDENVGDWSNIQGIQMEGKASVITDGGEIQRIMGMFLEKYPQIADLPPDFEMAVVKVEPSGGFFLDNTVAFGHRDQVEY